MLTLDTIEDAPVARIGANPVASWGKYFDGGTTPTADIANYPSRREVRAQFTRLRTLTLESLSLWEEADLDTRTKFQPAGLESHFETYGKTLLTLALHQMSHRSHLSDAVRAAGRPSSLTEHLANASVAILK